jgi:hypothetical protein
MAPLDSARPLLVAAILGASLVTASGCGSASTEADSTSAGAAAVGLKREAGERERAGYFKRLRDAVLRGAARDFALGSGIGGPAFESCVRGLMREALDRPTIIRLVLVYRRPHGQQFAAQALNGLAAPLAASCGHRTYVPELVEASRGLRAGRPTGAAVRTLGVTYGPYLGVRCWQADHIGCETVGIDVVFSAAATRVVAMIGDRRLRLHTPGMHSGAPYRDWVGTLTAAGMSRPASPLHVRGYGRGDGIWAGNPPVYVPVELRVRFADGRSAAALFPAVFLSPGWG